MPAEILPPDAGSPATSEPALAPTPVGQAALAAAQALARKATAAAASHCTAVAHFVGLMEGPATERRHYQWSCAIGCAGDHRPETALIAQHERSDQHGTPLSAKGTD